MTQTAILVLGMHRSGTSAVARVMNILGAQLPKTLIGQDGDNQRGHWESLAMTEHHDRIMAALGSDWRDWRALDLSRLGATAAAEIKADIGATFTAEYGEADVVMVKDPRICRLTATYLSALDAINVTPHVVLPIRHPMEVAGSLHTRDGISVHSGLMMWLSYTLQAEHESRGRSRAFTRYDSFLETPVKATQAIVERLGLAKTLPYSVDEVDDQIRDFVSPSLKRQDSTAVQLALDPRGGHWVADAYQALLVLCKNPDNAKALETLDGIRASFDPAADLIFDMVALSDKAAADLSHTQDILDGERAAHKEAWEQAQKDREAAEAGIWEQVKAKDADAAKALVKAQKSAAQAADDRRGEALSALQAAHERTLAEYTEVAAAREAEYAKVAAAREADIMAQFEAADRERKIETETIRSEARAAAIEARDARRAAEEALEDCRAQMAQMHANFESETAFMRQEFTVMLSHAETRAAAYEAESETLRSRVSQMETELGSVLNSTSWKMTGGLRFVLNTLRGRPRAKHVGEAAPKKRLTYRSDDRPE